MRKEGKITITMTEEDDGYISAKLEHENIEETEFIAALVTMIASFIVSDENHDIDEAFAMLRKATDHALQMAENEMQS